MFLSRICSTFKSCANTGLGQPCTLPLLQFSKAPSTAFPRDGNALVGNSVDFKSRGRSAARRRYLGQMSELPEEDVDNVI